MENCCSSQVWELNTYQEETDRILWTNCFVVKIFTESISILFLFNMDTQWNKIQKWYPSMEQKVSYSWNSSV